MVGFYQLYMQLLRHQSKNRLKKIKAGSKNLADDTDL